MYRTDCCTAHPVLLNRLSKVNTSCGLAPLIFIYQWGAEVFVVQHIFMSDWRALMTPPEGHPGQRQLAYTFLIRILQTSFISVSFFTVCSYSRVSISVVVLPLPPHFPCPPPPPPPVSLAHPSIPYTLCIHPATGCCRLSLKRRLLETVHMETEKPKVLTQFLLYEI